jgi:hypothetical protein
MRAIERLCQNLEPPVFRQGRVQLSSDFQSDREKVLDEYNDELLTKLVQELASTWRMRDAKLFSIIRKYRRVPIGAMKAAELHQSKDGDINASS